MRRQNVLHSPRLLELKRTKRKIHLKKMIVSVFFVFLVLVSLSFLYQWEKININDIQITGNKVTEAEKIKETVEKGIAGRYLWFFPKTNFLFYPRRALNRELILRFPRLESVSTNVDSFRILRVSVAERLPAYTWCGPEPDLEAKLPNIPNKCYFMDRNGYIFDEAPYFRGEVYFKFYGKADVDDNNPLGSYFKKTGFEKLVSLKGMSEKIPVKPVALYLEDEKNAKMFLSSPSVGRMGPKIIFEIDSDFEKILENLQLALATEPLQSDFQKKYSSLLYIDLRFENKVYYKFR